MIKDIIEMIIWLMIKKKRNEKEILIIYKSLGQWLITSVEVSATAWPINIDHSIISLSSIVKTLFFNIIIFWLEEKK